MKATEFICIILIVVLLIVGWRWAFKGDIFDPPHKIPLMYLLTIIGIGIVGSMFWNP